MRTDGGTSRGMFHTEIGGEVTEGHGGSDGDIHGEQTGHASVAVIGECRVTILAYIKYKSPDLLKRSLRVTPWILPLTP